MQLLYRKLFILILVIIVLLLANCFDSSDNGRVEAIFEIRDLGFDYSFQDTSIFIWAEVFDPEGNENIDSVRFSIYKIADYSDEILIDSGFLDDDGTEGDIISNDGIYSKKIIGINLDEGYYKLTVIAVNKSGEETEPGIFSGYVSINSAPVIYLLEAPKSFEKGDTLIFKIRASDPQGLDDIVSVRYFIKLPTGEIKTHYTWALRDDGQFGDEVAGDGIYTVYQPSNRNSKYQGTFSFYFYAQDLSGLFSDTLRVDIRNPGVTLKSPNGGECYNLGDTIKISWESAFILQLKLEIIIVDKDQTINIDTVYAMVEEYNWVVPADFPMPSNCKIRVFDIEKDSRSDMSDEIFKIGNCK